MDSEAQPTPAKRTSTSEAAGGYSNPEDGLNGRERRFVVFNKPATGQRNALSKVDVVRRVLAELHH